MLTRIFRNTEMLTRIFEQKEPSEVLPLIGFTVIGHEWRMYIGYKDPGADAVVVRIVVTNSRIRKDNGLTKSRGTVYCRPLGCLRWDY